MNMKSISAGYILFYFLTLHAGSIETIDSLVTLYQEKAIKQTGQFIKVEHIDSDIFQMTGGHDQGKLVLRVYKKIVTDLSDNGLIAAACHELGHIFGEIPLSAVSKGTRFDPLDSVEGEADYFAGKCTKYFFSSLKIQNPTNLAIASEIEILSKVYRELNIHNLETPLPEYEGINSSYPSAECRFQSFKAGVFNHPRPKCWFNPSIEYFETP